MNKSELIILKELKEIDELKQENMKLKDKVEGLQDRIDSAINYIESKSEKQYGFNFEYNLEETEIQDLLDILKGE